MCGIAGKLIYDSSAKIEADQIHAMLHPIAHRGPDGHGVYLDGNVGLGHCRLSIIDLSTGDQPMANEDESVWIVFNGEIYNFQELREGLLARGHRFRSRTDTEVIIHLYEELGPECVQQLRGMFAFAIWDTKRRRLFIARDRVGIKPLYYCQTGGAFYFGSELKAILADRAIAREINLPAVRSFFSFNYVPGEATLLKGILKLLPGHYLTVEQGRVATRQYWDLKYNRSRWETSFEQATEELHRLLGATVRDHMIADVPVGVLLSGGVDSSAVLSFAVQATPKKVKTFTVGFDGGQVVDERPYARAAAEACGTDHHEITISSSDFWGFLPAYIQHMEEPVCEPPAVALYYVSKLAREHVKVVLSGEGGDEAFAGYPDYPNMLRMDRLQKAAGPFARLAGEAAFAMGSAVGDPRVQRYAEAMGRPLWAHYFSRTSGPSALFHRCASRLFNGDFLEQTAAAAAAPYIEALVRPVTGEPLLNQMLYVDTKTWLPDDLLIKADKITMANSLELRVPLLDHVVLEFAASLPPQFKVEGAQTKRVLKAAFAKVLPPEVLNRKKAGFPVPYAAWLRNGLKHKVEEVLLSDRAAARGYVRRRELESLLRGGSERGGHPKEVFSLLTLELWHRAFLDQ